jgi:ubiquinone/menaquinone biosynthesis C-methylase UbiE
MLIKKFWKLYPSINRAKISSKRIKVSSKIKKKLKKFGVEYFDGDRSHGYGGYYYNKKFFRRIARSLIKHYKLNNQSKILDVGCAKGFLMYDLKHYLPKAEIKGIDISSYCKKNAISTVKQNIKICSCSKLPFKNNYFDLVISISTIHNLKKNQIKKSLKEITRVGKNKFFIRVKAYKNLKEKKKIDNWNLVAESNLSQKEWFNLFSETKYSGDFDFSNF